jgi:hypothetical protein
MEGDKEGDVISELSNPMLGPGGLALSEYDKMKLWSAALKPRFSR